MYKHQRTTAGMSSCVMFSIHAWAAQCAEYSSFEKYVQQKPAALARLLQNYN